MRLMLAVAAGGAAGSVARYLLQGWVQRRTSETSGWLPLLPTGTLAVNLLGCVAIGLLATLLQERVALDPALRSGLLIGVLGGFTTFSAFGWETLGLLRAGNLLLAGAYVVASVALGLAGVWLGIVVARAL
jgi:CrcB protein